MPKPPKHQHLCDKLRDLLRRLCPERPLRVGFHFSRPVPKTCDDTLRAALAALLWPPRGHHGGHPMADFSTTIDDTQKVLATAALTKADGTAVPITGMTLTQTAGDATFSMNASDGTALPVNQVFLISGPTDGTSSWDVSIANAVKPSQATLILTVIAGVLNVSFSFGTPEPK